MVADCHCNWAAMAPYKAEGREPGSLPKIDCATGQLTLRYRKPTPMGVPLRLRARWTALWGAVRASFVKFMRAMI